MCKPITVAVLVVLFCASSLAARGQKSRDCPALRRQAWQCVQNVHFLGLDSSVSTVESSDCYLRSNTTCLRNYFPCMPRKMRRTVILSVALIQQLLRRICDNPYEREQLLRSRQCIADDLRRKRWTRRFSSLLNKLTHSLVIVRDRLADDEQFAGLCCSYEFFYHGIHSIMMSLCDEVTGPDNAKYLSGVVRSVMSLFADMDCSAYSSPEECEERSPNVTTAIAYSFLQKNMPAVDDSFVLVSFEIVAAHLEDD